MTTVVHRDGIAPKCERWRVLRADMGRIASFPTEREAKAFAQGYTLGAAKPAPKPLDDRMNEALRLVKLARDDYRREVRELRAQLAAH